MGMASAEYTLFTLSHHATACKSSLRVAGAFDQQSGNLRLLLARQVAQIALDRLNDEPPLRLFPDLAQCEEFVACLCRQPEAHLRIILHALAVVARRRAADPSHNFPLLSSRHREFEVCASNNFR